MRKLFLLMFSIMCMFTNCTTPDDQWLAVPGGGDLTEDPSWGCPGWIEAEDGVVYIGAGEGVHAYINHFGPQLYAEGDFGLAATFTAREENLVSISLIGKLGVGDWWDGTNRLDVGVEKGQVVVNFYNGLSFMPSVAETFPTEDLTGDIKLELRRVGDILIVWANGKEVGQLEDPGILPDGTAYFGGNIRPYNLLTLKTLTITAPPDAVDAVSVRPMSDASAYTITEPPLRDLADARGILIGPAVEPHYIRCEPPYDEVLQNEFNLIVSENAFKFGPIHPEPDTFNFDGTDALVAYAEEHDMVIRGHALVWHQMVPAWVENAEMSAAEWEALLHNHITTVVSRYKGQVDVWDVVNEAISEEANATLRDTVWLENLGEAYIDNAFIWAHEADPDALLFYNDYGAEGIKMAKSDKVYELVKGMVERGVPIHGVGLQAHLSIGESPTPESIQQNIQRLGALGLQVHFTELDIRLPTNSREQFSNTQTQLYRELLEVCLAEENCTAFVMWGFTDKHSWIPGQFPGYDHALIFDRTYAPKPAYFGLREALDKTSESQ